MPEEENKAAARRIAVEAFNHKAIPELQRGIDGFKEAVRWVLAAFPDLRYEIER